MLVMCFRIGLILLEIGMKARRRVESVLHVVCVDWSDMVPQFSANTFKIPECRQT